MRRDRVRTGQFLLVLFATLGLAVTQARAQRGGMMRPAMSPAMAPRPGMGMPGMTSGFMGMPGMTSGFMGSGGMTPGFMGSPGMTSGFMGSGGMTSGFMGSGGMTAGSMGSGGYGSPAGGYGNTAGGYGYGSAGTGYAPATQLSTTSAGTNDSQKAGLDHVELILTACGVPNDAGKLRWPLAIRIDRTNEGDRLRRQADALFQVAALQAQVGRVNPGLKSEMTGAVEGLRRNLQTTKERVLMSGVIYEDSERFLERLTKAWGLVENAMTAPGGKYGQFQEAGEGR